MPTAPLLKPIGVSSVHNDSSKTIKISWVTPKDLTGIKDYGFQFVSKTDAKVIPLPATATASATSPEGDNTVSTITVTDATQYASLKDALAQVQSHTKDATVNANSDWGTEVVWSAAPTLTITIGSNTYTLSQSSFGGATSTIYKLPVSADNPLSISYDDMKAFAKSLPGSPTLPTNYPNGTPITGSLDISELIIDTGKKLFSLSIAASIPYEIFPGLSVKKLGLSLKRTDGSL